MTDLEDTIDNAVEDAVRPVRRFPIYVASKINHYGMWKDLRRKWRIEGIDIVSTWIDAVAANGGTDDHVTPLAAAGSWIQNVRDVTAANACLVYADLHDGPLRGALVEAGIAIGQHKPVIVVGPKDIGSWGTWQYHPLVSYAFELSTALNILHAWMGRKMEPRS